MSRSKTGLWHRILTHTLPLYFPEAERFHRSSRTDWFLAFLEKYPSPHLITTMDKDAFFANAWDVVGRNCSNERLLSDIYATAVESVGLLVHPDSDAVRMFRPILSEGRSLIRQRDEIEARAIELLSDQPDYQLLTTIPRIGPINAMTVLAEPGDLRRFRHHRQYLKFCGMNLVTVQSGMFRGQSRISKYGNTRLRRTPWRAGPPFSSGPAASATSSSVTSRRIATTPICAAGYTAIAAKMARTVHTVVKTRRTLSPLLRGGEPRRKDLAL